MKARGAWLMVGVLAVVACKKPVQQQATAAPAGPAPGSPEWKIQNAMSAGPASIAATATIMDWPASDTGHMTQLRQGSNGWTCLPDMPQTPGPDQMCYDAQWGHWAEGWMAHKAPVITSLGVAYMLAGGIDASNTDPYAMHPDSGKSWIMSGPHLMVLTPGAHAYDAISGEVSNDAPYVMFKGTPYAMLMVPVGGMPPHQM